VGRQVRRVGNSHVPNPPPYHKRHVKKKRECTLEKTPSLEKPLPTIMAHFEIDATYNCCNTTKPSTCKMHAKPKEKGL